MTAPLEIEVALIVSNAQREKTTEQMAVWTVLILYPRKKSGGRMGTALIANNINVLISNRKDDDKRPPQWTISGVRVDLDPWEEAE